MAAAVALLCAVFPCFVNAKALDAYDSAADSGVYSVSGSTVKDSGPNPAPEDTAATFDEMRDWLERYKGKDRTLYLTSDITVDTNYQFMTRYGDGWGTLTVDTGPYTIYVEGALEIRPNLNFVGHGGTQGVFQVRSGGLLALADVTVRASNGCTVRQMPSSAFFAYPTPQNVEWGAEPIAVPVSALYPKNVPVAIVQAKDGNWEDALPKTATSYLFTNQPGENGEMHDIYLPQEIAVAWDTEDFLQQFLDQERFYLTGRYTEGMGTLRESHQPSCLVVFQKAPSVFLYCELNRPSPGVITGLFSFIDPGIPYKIEVSPDGENNWEWIDEAEPSWSIGESYDSDACNLIFEIEENEERWFRIAFDGEDEPVYSEVVGVRDGEVLPLDIEGGRGGGTDLLPPFGSIAPPQEEATEGGSDNDNSAHGGDTGFSSAQGHQDKAERPVLRSQSALKEKSGTSLPEMSGALKNTVLPKKQAHGALPPTGDLAGHAGDSYVPGMASPKEASEKNAAQGEAAMVERAQQDELSPRITAESGTMQEAAAVVLEITPTKSAPLSPRAQTAIGWALLGGCVAGSGAVFWGAPAITARLRRYRNKLTGKSNSP